MGCGSRGGGKVVTLEIIDYCINSNNAAPTKPAIASCMPLLEAWGRNQRPEGAAGYLAHGNLHAVRGDVERAMAHDDRAIMLDPNCALAFFNRAERQVEAARSTAPSRT